MRTKGLTKTTALVGFCVLAVAVARLLPGSGASGETKSQPMREVLAIQNAFVEVAETTAKAVVTISSAGTVPIQDPWIQFYYGGGEAQVRGLGSGVIFDKRGYVITNDHVIEILSRDFPGRIRGDQAYVMADGRTIQIDAGKVPVHPVGRSRFTVTAGKAASDINVTLPDGRTFSAAIQGRDRLLDIALLKMQGVDGQDLPVAKLGDSSVLRVGHLVLAIGNPYGSYQYLDSPRPTVTDGIISALERTFPTDDERRSYGGLIQTSAAINRGNSGGPLVNITGEVIGINAAIFSTSQGSEGIGFAVPINRVKARLKDLIAGDKIEYGFLGVNPAEIDPQKAEALSKSLGWNIPRGVIIAGEPGGAAEKAGLKSEDIIVKVGDKGIVNSAQLIDLLANTPVGETFPITVVREGKRIVKNVTIGGRTRQYINWDGRLED